MLTSLRLAPAYFAMVIAFYGPVAYWLVKRDDPGPAMQ